MNQTALMVSSLMSLTVISIGALILLFDRKQRQSLKQQWQQRLQARLWEFLIVASVRKVTFGLLLAALPLLLTLIVWSNLVWGLLATLSCLAAVPWLVQQLRQRRHQRIDQQLPDTMMLLAHAMASGMSLLPALELSQQQLSEPLRGEFALLLQRLKLGESLPQALTSLTQRTPTHAIRYFVFTMQLGVRYGGQQSVVLQRMAFALQQQQQAQQRLLSLSAQARLQGRVMFCLPLALFLILHWLQPANTEVLLTTRSGWILLALSVVLLLLGAMLVRTIMRHAADA